MVQVPTRPGVVKPCSTTLVLLKVVVRKEFDRGIICVTAKKWPETGSLMKWPGDLVAMPVQIVLADESQGPFSSQTT
jgi:hypothetical protein